jgi:hypothetical protein
MLESLALSAALVLVAAGCGKANAMTALGTAHGTALGAEVFLIGTPWARTGLWSVPVIGLVLIFSRFV